MFDFKASWNEYNYLQYNTLAKYGYQFEEQLTFQSSLFPTVSI